jgi:hypothetical protein
MCRHQLWVFVLFSLASPTFGFDIDGQPVDYHKAPADNVVSRLEKQLQSGQASLKHDKKFGYLRDLLRELSVPESSQVLVFSKTSLQRHKIGPDRPRAIYFNDQVYVGMCRNGDVLEVSAADPKLGTVFYTVDQRKTDRARITRQADSCLICHASSHNQGVPGHVVRSVYSDEDGQPLLGMGTYRTDQTSPLKQRWGGWYVTGNSGRQTHMGNLILQGHQDEATIDLKPGSNLSKLDKFFESENCLTPHSDLIALMVMEHQAQMHNLIARATTQIRVALWQEQDINKSLDRPSGYRSETTTRQIQSAGDAVLRYMLFCDEAPLTDPIAGTSKFTSEFPAHGPRDAKGRSLRDLNLSSRLFKHPCSYLIYTAEFDALPAEVRDHVMKRLHAILTNKDKSAEFSHLSGSDRNAILEILLATKTNLPEYWRKK